MSQCAGVTGDVDFSVISTLADVDYLSVAGKPAHPRVARVAGPVVHGDRRERIRIGCEEGIGTAVTDF